MKMTKELIQRLPKSDLHLHLDGSIRLSTLVELAQQERIPLPASTEQGLREKVFKDQYRDLGEYLQGFNYTCQVLQTSTALERVAYELVVDNINEGVRYIEVRFAPQLHLHKELGMIDVLQAVDRGLATARDEFNGRDEVKSGKDIPFEYGLIVCAMRMFDYGYSDYFNRLLDVHQHSDKKLIFSLASQELVRAAVLARNKYKIPIVGFDLAGMEKGYPAEDHKDAYELAHRNFLMKTVHAGEAFGPESIFQAITDLHADRIGHGLHLFNADMIKGRDIKNRQAYINYLAEYIANRRITIEVCLTSNMQTNPEIRDLKDHPFGKMRQAKLSTTFCTDNRTVSRTTVSDEIVKAIEAFDISAKELKDLIVYGFKRSFFRGTYLEKRSYVRRVIDYYEAVEKKFQ